MAEENKELKRQYNTWENKYFREENRIQKEYELEKLRLEVNYERIAASSEPKGTPEIRAKIFEINLANIEDDYELAKRNLRKQAVNHKSSETV
eukprot:764023_1